MTPIDLPELEYEPEHTYDDPAANADFKAYQAAASNQRAPRSVEPRPYLTPQDSEWGKKVDAADRYVRRAEGMVEGMQADPYQRMMHRPTLAMARDSVLLGDQSLAGGALEEGQAYLEVALSICRRRDGICARGGLGQGRLRVGDGHQSTDGAVAQRYGASGCRFGVMTVGIGSKLAKFGKVANLLRRFGRTERLHDKILHEVSDIITDPSVRWEANRTVRGIDRFKARGIRDDVEIEVIVEPKGEGIISAWPVSGHGVSVNPL